MNAHGEKVGLIKVRLYRPWRADKLISAIPATWRPQNLHSMVPSAAVLGAGFSSRCKKIAVLDRTKEPGSLGEPLYVDVVASLANAGRTDITVIGGRYGLGSKDTPPRSVCVHGLHVAHLLQVLVVPHGHLLDLVGGPEAVEEVDEGNAALDGGQMGHGGQVHNLLGGSGPEEYLRHHREGHRDAV